MEQISTPVHNLIWLLVYSHCAHWEMKSIKRCLWRNSSEQIQCLHFFAHFSLWEHKKPLINIIRCASNDLSVSQNWICEGKCSYLHISCSQHIFQNTWVNGRSLYEGLRNWGLLWILYMFWHSFRLGNSARKRWLIMGFLRTGLAVYRILPSYGVLH